MRERRDRGRAVQRGFSLQRSSVPASRPVAQTASERGINLQRLPPVSLSRGSSAARSDNADAPFAASDLNATILIRAETSALVDLMQPALGWR
jgi:hypothetical protein